MTLSFPETPLILWSQTFNAVSLRIIMDKMTKTSFCFNENQFYFQVRNKAGKLMFNLHLEFYGRMDKVGQTDRAFFKMDFLIVKETPEWWPRLLLTEEKTSELIVNLDKWRNPYGEEEVNDDDDPFTFPMSTVTADILHAILVNKLEIF